MTLPFHRLVLLLAFGACFVAPVRAEPMNFNLPAQPADRALLAFAKQAKVDILFSFDELSQVAANPVVGKYEPADALQLLLRDTGYAATQTAESKWIVRKTGPPSGKVRGKLLAPDGSPARRVRITIKPIDRADTTNDAGEFEFGDVPPGEFTLLATAPDCRPLQIVDVAVIAQRITLVPTQRLQHVEDPTKMEPFVVQGRPTHTSPLDHSDAPFAPRTAGGNLDLARTESDALPYMIFNRSQIARSGVVNLSEFLQRELIDSNAGALPPEQDPNPQTSLFTVGSKNLSLRGYSADETVILVNGRRLPEVVTSMGSETLPPDVNLIPLSLVQQVEVLPVSASSLYSGNAVGGVINIVLRPDVDTNRTEINATYTNTVGHFDAPQSSLSVMHARTMLNGALRVRLNASFARSLPATEAELGFRERRFREDPNPDIQIFRATPYVRTIRPQLLPLAPGFDPDQQATEPSSPSSTVPPQPPLPPLFGPGTPAYASVAPGADGTGGLAAFAGRQGVRNLAFFDSPGAFSTGIDSLDFPYGRKQRRATYYGSVVYDAFPWLQIAGDGMFTQTVINRGLDVLAAELQLRSTSPFNPFHQDVRVTLNETAPALGDGYAEARLNLASAVLSAMVKLPAEWRMVFDLQYSNNVVKYRGLVGASVNDDRWHRWQDLVDQGGYNPLRDTRVFGPPAAFYDQVLIYNGARGRMVTIGDYDTMDLAGRISNEKLRLPTGQGVVNVGADYRRNHLAKYREEHRFADGTLFDDPRAWDARTLGRYSFFGEVQAPIVPVKWLPKWLLQAESDLALRYVASSSTKEANFAPTYATKLVFPGGFTFRGSITTSSRFPTPIMSRQIFAPSTEPGTASVNREFVTDYRRNETYAAVVNEVTNPDLRPEQAVTQTAGLIFERGQTHRIRVALDFVDTHKVDELTTLDKQTITANEALFPDRVQRAPADRNDPTGIGLIQSVTTGRSNLASRFSQDWTASVDYRWNACFGGTLEAYARTLYFQRYMVRALPSTPRVDELNQPDGLVPLLKYRSNFGASWSNKAYALGFDGHYFHSRLLPVQQRVDQGHDRIRPYWQFDIFGEIDVARWLPWDARRYGLRLQARVNNVLGAPYPKFADDPYSTGVQPYGDWRGRVYSLSLTATF